MRPSAVGPALPALPPPRCVWLQQRPRRAPLQVRFILSLTGRVAIMLATPAVVLLLLGLMMATRCLPTPWAKLPIDQGASQLLQLLLGFPAWWACATWFCYSSMMMCFSRFGLVSSNRVYFE